MERGRERRSIIKENEYVYCDRPADRPAEYHVFDDSPANEVLHGINGLAQEFQRGATMDGRRNAKTKRERGKRGRKTLLRNVTPGLLL